jgi:outer membrane protein insertion porin family
LASPRTSVRAEAAKFQALTFHFPLLMRVFFASVLVYIGALSAAVPARAQTPPAGQAPALTQAPVSAQTPAAPAAAAQASSSNQAPLDLPATICGLTVPAPSRLPPANSPPMLYQIMPCFEKQGGFPVVEANTYLYYIQLATRVSRPSVDQWVPYSDEIERIIVADFKRLWGTNFLDDLAAEVRDVRFSNGVIGKVVVYNMEERQRVKIVDFVGTDKVDQSKIDDKLKEKQLQIRLDSFIDPGLLRRVADTVREVYASEGHQFAEVKPEITEVEGGPKLVNVTFHINEGPKVRIREIEFVGNKDVGDGSLRRRMKENKGGGFFSFILKGGTYKEEKFEDDAQNLIDYYRDRGYVRAQVGQPELKTLEDSADQKTRWVQLQVPITEGKQYKVGDFKFEGNTVAKGEGLRPLFKIDPGETYSQKKIKKGIEKVQEVYGAGGYYEFTAYPDLKPRDQPAEPADGNGNGSGAAGPPAPGGPKAPAPVPSLDQAASNGNSAKNGSAAKSGKPGKSEAPLVDVVLRIQEGKQYFVNRITFTGNTTTRDNVIRREMRLIESNVFNTEALKYSVRRLNQLGYFKELKGDAIQVEKTPNADNKVDVSLKFEEQNRNQLTFGAGVSQFDGFFGQLSFQTSNFMGRGETFSISAQQGDRAKNYQVAFTEPFLFDRPITAGVDLFIREIRYINQFTQASTGGNFVYGFQVSPFSRVFVNYSYENVKVKELNPLYLTIGATNPFLADSLLLGKGGHRTISKIGPSYVFNTVDNPITPTTGKRLTASLDVAGLGGNTNFVNPRVEGVWYHALNRRTSLGFRAQAEYINPYGSSVALPIYEKLYLGGEYSMRGFDLRTVGPRDPATGLVLGGNKSLLFNAEYLINVVGPVRLVLFYDAGQVRDRGESFGWKENLTAQQYPPQLVGVPLLYDPFAVGSLRNPLDIVPQLETVVTGEANAFKTSTGAEIRFFMPVLNVPFRLIFAMNPSRAGVLDSNLRPEKKYKFRFAVGSTF